MANPQASEPFEETQNREIQTRILISFQATKTTNSILDQYAIRLSDVYNHHSRDHRVEYDVFERYLICNLH